MHTSTPTPLAVLFLLGVITVANAQLVNVDDTDQRLIYRSPGAPWVSNHNVAANWSLYGNTDSVSQVRGANVTLKDFPGNLIQYWGDQGPLLGRCRVIVDGMDAGLYTGYNATFGTPILIYSRNDLDPTKNHTISVIVNDAAPPNMCEIDRFVYNVTTPAHQSSNTGIVVGGALAAFFALTVVVLVASWFLFCRKGRPRAFSDSPEITPEPPMSYASTAVPSRGNSGSKSKLLDVEANAGAPRQSGESARASSSQGHNHLLANPLPMPLRYVTPTVPAPLAPSSTAGSWDHSASFQAHSSSAAHLPLPGRTSTTSLQPSTRLEAPPSTRNNRVRSSPTPPSSRSSRHPASTMAASSTDRLSNTTRLEVPSRDRRSRNRSSPTPVSVHSSHPMPIPAAAASAERLSSAPRPESQGPPRTRRVRRRSSPSPAPARSSHYHVPSTAASSTDRLSSNAHRSSTQTHDYRPAASSADRLSSNAHRSSAQVHDRRTVGSSTDRLSSGAHRSSAPAQEYRPAASSTDRLSSNPHRTSAQPYEYRPAASSADRLSSNPPRTSAPAQEYHRPAAASTDRLSTSAHRALAQAQAHEHRTRGSSSHSHLPYQPVVEPEPVPDYIRRMPRPYIERERDPELPFPSTSAPADRKARGQNTSSAGPRPLPQTPAGPNPTPAPASAGRAQAQARQTQLQQRRQDGFEYMSPALNEPDVPISMPSQSTRRVDGSSSSAGIDYSQVAADVIGGSIPPVNSRRSRHR